MSFGVYIHFPYCRKRCPYCDFAIHVRRRIPHAEYAAAVCRAFTPAGDPEVTLEANPDDLPAPTLAALREAGVNRLSVGAQSFDAGQLARLGRLHGAAEIVRAARDARAAGFDNVSFDLI